jgi:hypothetical protein
MNKGLRRTLKEALIESFSVFSGGSEGKSAKNIIIGLRFELGTSHKRSRSATCGTEKPGIIKVYSLNSTP